MFQHDLRCVDEFSFSGKPCYQFQIWQCYCFRAFELDQDVRQDFIKFNPSGMRSCLSGFNRNPSHQLGFAFRSGISVIAPITLITSLQQNNPTEQIQIQTQIQEKSTKTNTITLICFQIWHQCHCTNHTDPVSDETKNLNETETETFFRYQNFSIPNPILFSIPKFSETDTDTFFDTKNFRNRYRYFFRNLFFPKPIPILITIPFFSIPIIIIILIIIINF